jgi:hypothetical protein
MACVTNYTTQCTDVTTGKTGCFLFDTERWQRTGEFRAVSPIFPSLIEFFKWDAANGSRGTSVHLERI